LSFASDTKSEGFLFGKSRFLHAADGKRGAVSVAREILRCSFKAIWAMKNTNPVRRFNEAGEKHKVWISG